MVSFGKGVRRRSCPFIDRYLFRQSSLSTAQPYCQVTMADGTRKERVCGWAYIRNERGAMLAAAIIFLFFVSLFLFSIVSWHDIL